MSQFLRFVIVGMTVFHSILALAQSVDPVPATLDRLQQATNAQGEVDPVKCSSSGSLDHRRTCAQDLNDLIQQCNPKRTKTKAMPGSKACDSRNAQFLKLVSKLGDYVQASETVIDDKTTQPRATIEQLKDKDLPDYKLSDDSPAFANLTENLQKACGAYHKYVNLCVQIDRGTPIDTNNAGMYPEFPKSSELATTRDDAAKKVKSGDLAGAIAAIDQVHSIEQLKFSRDGAALLQIRMSKADNLKSFVRSAKGDKEIIEDCEMIQQRNKEDCSTVSSPKTSKETVQENATH